MKFTNTRKLIGEEEALRNHQAYWYIGDLVTNSFHNIIKIE